MTNVQEISDIQDGGSDHLKDLFGVRYIPEGVQDIVTARADDLYYYQTYVGAHTIDVAFGDCVYYIADDRKSAVLQRGEATVESAHIATVIRGYMPENKTSGIETQTVLPYVNGCSTKQIFPPDRLGDPTLQMLNIPPHSAEQAHHIHSTVRVVYVLSGSGRSVVGMEQMSVTERLLPGMTIVLEKMCPHHFETDDEHLVVIPLHVFSSVGSMESNHPMFNGTHMTG